MFVRPAASCRSVSVITQPSELHEASWTPDFNISSCLPSDLCVKMRRDGRMDVCVMYRSDAPCRPPPSQNLNFSWHSAGGDLCFQWVETGVYCSQHCGSGERLVLQSYPVRHAHARSHTQGALNVNVGSAACKIAIVLNISAENRERLSCVVERR